MRREKWKANGFYDEAIQYLDSVIDTGEILKIDQTELFEREIELMIKQGEIIKIEIKAKPGEGKSTLGIKIALNIHELLKKYRYIKEEERFNLRNIARDQQEFNRKMMDNKLRNNIIVIDEFNELEDSGENVTAEKRQANTISDVHRYRYVHTINCSPHQIIDRNSDLILEIIPLEKNKEFITRARLYYRFTFGGEERVILLGHINIYVGDIIKNWEKRVRKVFQKTERGKEDEEFIKEQAKKDFYVRYMIGKEMKAEMLSKEGIFRPRELLYASVVLEIINEFEPIARLGEKVSKDMIETITERKYREKKIVTSMLGIIQTARRICGILNGLAEKRKIKSKKIKFISEIGKRGIIPNNYEEILKSYDNAIDRIEKGFKESKEELEHYKRVNQKYNEVEEW